MSWIYKPVCLSSQREIRKRLVRARIELLSSRQCIHVCSISRKYRGQTRRKGVFLWISRKRRRMRIQRENGRDSCMYTRKNHQTACGRREKKSLSIRTTRGESCFLIFLPEDRKRRRQGSSLSFFASYFSYLSVCLQISLLFHDFSLSAVEACGRGKRRSSIFLFREKDSSLCTWHFRRDLVFFFSISILSFFFFSGLSRPLLSFLVLS